MGDKITGFGSFIIPKERVWPPKALKFGPDVLVKYKLVI